MNSFSLYLYMYMILSIIYFVVGIVLVILGADWLTKGASDMARRLKMSELMIGLTIVAIGTSLPELVISVSSALSGNSGISLGNVLGSNGSVIPRFKEQIANGGPVTVTHPEIIRYFMTIPEAVSLVLQAGAYAKGGEIFVLDMGEPVKILDLAKNLIQLSGYKVGEDIEIVFTGLRPGEKMYEELLMNEEGLQDTENKLIHIGKPIVFDEQEFEKALERLRTAAESENEDVRSVVQELVPTYHP